LLSAASAFVALAVTATPIVLPASAAPRRTAAVAPSPTGSVSLFAGGFGHGPASSLRTYPSALAYRNGTLYVADKTTPTGGSAFVRKIDLATGATAIVLGGGSRPATDLRNGSLPATQLRPLPISGLAVDDQGRLLVGTGIALAVSSGGVATAVTHPSINSNERCSSCDGQPGARPSLGYPDVATDDDGSLLFADRRVYRVGADGRTWTLLGNDSSVEANGLREGIPGSLTGAYARSVTPDGSGGAFFTTRRSELGAAPAVGDALRHVDSRGIVTTVAQDSSLPITDPALPAGARSAGLGSPLIVRSVSDGLLVATTSGVWHRGPSGSWTRSAGGGTAVPADNVPAVGTALAPKAMAPDDNGGFLVGTTDHVWRVDSGGVLHLIEGTGTGYSGDGGQATDATFGDTRDVARASDGTVYIRDGRANVIRAVAADGRIRAFAGSGARAKSGDGGPATAAGFGALGRLAADGLGNVYVPDGNSVRKIDAGGVITTIAGNGTTAPDLAGPVSGTATSIIPSNIAVTEDGTLFITEPSRQRVRKLTAQGTLSTVLDANSTGHALTAGAIAVDGTTLYVSDAMTGEIWRTIAGGAPTLYATVRDPIVDQLVVDGAHHLYGLGVLHQVVRIDADGTKTQVVGTIIEDANTRFADTLAFPVAPIEAIAPIAISSDGADGLLGADLYGDVWHYAGIGSDLPAPPRPGYLSTIPGDRSLHVNWRPTLSGVAPTSYTVTASPGGASVTVSGTQTSATLTGLTNGTAYSVAVQATDASGTSYPSKAVLGTPMAPGVPPSAPRRVSAWPLANGTVDVTWEAPASSGFGSITVYTVQAPTGTFAVPSCTSCPLYANVPATVGGSATYRVVATSAGGSTVSAPTSAVVAGTAPGAVANLRVIPHNQLTTVVWDGPTPISGHPIGATCAQSASGWGTCPAGGVTAISVPSQAPGSPEQLSVQVGNDLGIVSSEPAEVTTSTVPPPAAPAAVSGITASAAWHGVHVAWTPPATGSAVRDSIVTLLPERRSLVIASDQHSADFTGVTPGTAHTVSVTTDGDGGLGTAATSGVVNVAPDPPGLFRPVAQFRVNEAALRAGHDYDMQIAAPGGLPADADAVLVNVEVSSPTQAGYLRVTPGGSNSATAVQEFAAGQTISNAVAVKFGPGGTIRLHLSAGSATVFVDVAGVFTRSGPGDAYLPVPQARVHGPTSLRSGADKDVVVAGRGGIPADADAVLVNVEVSAPSKAGYLRVTPGGSNSATAVQEFSAGQTISTLVAVKLGPGGTIRLHLSAGSATVFVDVAGAFVSNRSADAYRPVPQARVSGPLALTAGQDRDVVIAGKGGIPVNADAVLVNVEVSAPSRAGYLRVTPGGSTSSTAVQEFAVGQTISALVPVKLGPGGTIRLHLSAGTATVFVDVAGAFVSS
jgi:hypothetical protein